MSVLPLRQGVWLFSHNKKIEMQRVALRFYPARLRVTYSSHMKFLGNPREAVTLSNQPEN